jgi:hypothetical protein
MQNPGIIVGMGIVKLEAGAGGWNIQKRQSFLLSHEGGFFSKIKFEGSHSLEWQVINQRGSTREVAV